MSPAENDRDGRLPVETSTDDRASAPHNAAIAKRAGPLQVAKTLFFAMIMVGSRKTWEGDGDGARMTPAQVVIGGIIAGIIIVAALITLVHVILGLATR